MAMRAIRIIAGYAIVLGCALGCASRGPVSAYSLVVRDPFAGVGNAPPPALDLDNPADLAWTLLELDAALVGDPAREEIRARVVAHELARTTAALARDDVATVGAGFVTIANLWRFDELEQGRVAGLAPAVELTELLFDRSMAKRAEAETLLTLAVLIAADPVRASRREVAYRAAFPDVLLKGEDPKQAERIPPTMAEMFPSPWLFAEFLRRWNPTWKSSAPTSARARAEWQAELEALARPDDPQAIDGVLFATSRQAAWLRGRRWCRAIPNPRAVSEMSRISCVWVITESARLLAEREQVDAAVERLAETHAFAGKDETTPVGARARAAIASAYVRLGDRHAAEHWLAQAQAMSMTDASVQGAAGRVALWRGEYRAAVELLALAAQAEEDRWKRAGFYRSAVEALVLAGAPEEARAFIDGLDDDALLGVRGYFLALAGDLEGARGTAAVTEAAGQGMQLVSALIASGHIGFARDVWERAQPSFADVDAESVTYETMKLVALDRANGRAVDPRMLAVLRAPGASPWVALLARFVAGDVSFSDLLPASTDRDQRTEALFYEALFAQGRGEVAAARQLLLAVVAGGSPALYEYDLARRWLATGIPR